MKKAIHKLTALVLAFVMLLPLSATAYNKGDVNGDGVVTAADGELIFNYVSNEGVALTDTEKQAADVDGDGNVTVGDATQILRYASGAEGRLPANAVARLNILSPPYKLNYRVGEQFNMEGFMLSVTYTGGQSRLVRRYSYTDFEDSVGVKLITVACRGKLVSFTVQVEEPRLSELSIVSLPGKRSYTVGQSLSLDGLMAMGVYENGTSTVINGYSVSGYDGTPGIHNVRIMYMGKTAEFTVGCGYSATVNCGGTRLNVRSGPGKSYGTVDAFYEGTRIVAVDIESYGDWVMCWGKAVSGNYVYGWCSKALLNIQN